MTLFLLVIVSLVYVWRLFDIHFVCERFRTVQNGSETCSGRPRCTLRCFQAERPSGSEAKKLEEVLGTYRHIPDMDGLMELPLSKLEQKRVNVAWKSLKATSMYSERRCIIGLL